MSPEFSAKTIDTLARRSALRCSNPDCDKLTSGPNLDPLKVTNIGEAAHIYGARLGSARYRENMSDHDRGTLSNALWLCRDCHGLIDKDPFRYSVELLILWKESHEAKIIREIGKPGDLVRLQLENKEMAQFSELPGFIRLLIKDKPKLWEYAVTSELLDYFLESVIEEAGDLKDGLYSRPLTSLMISDFLDWSTARNSELVDVVDVLRNLLEAMMKSWGAPGVPGDARRIVHICRRMEQSAQRLIAIANETRFTKMPDEFEGIGSLLSDGALHIVYRFPEISRFLRSVLAQPNPAGMFHFDLVIDFPEGWPEQMCRLIENGRRAINR